MSIENELVRITRKVWKLEDRHEQIRMCAKWLLDELDGGGWIAPELQWKADQLREALKTEGTD